MLPLHSIVVMMALAGFSLTVPVESIARVFGELTLAGAIALVSLVNIVFVALALPDADAVRIADWVDDRITLGAR
jgi:hypothetical protein